jgi:iron transport multicopper oxidase
MANFGVNPTSGALPQQNYFEPYNYDSPNGGDRDFGSSGVALLDSSLFKATGVSCITVAGGKSGVIYVMNTDNPGGFKNGSSEKIPQGLYRC